MAGSPRITTSVKISGPLLTGHDAMVIKSFLLEAEDEVAAQASAHVHQFLDGSIKHPTPYYETQITTQRLAGDAVVNDRGVVYGPWLEGTSRMNAATRFKGYHSFQRAGVATKKDVSRIVLAVMRRYIGRL